VTTRAGDHRVRAHSRSWELIKASGAVLRQDKELLLFPLFSGIATLVLFASFMIPLVATGAIERMNPENVQAPLMLFAFVFYLVQYFIIFFFNSALVGAAMIRLDGGDPTVRDGLRIAGSRVVQILGYAAIAATVGLILRMLEERLGILGRWIAGLLGIGMLLFYAVAQTGNNTLVGFVFAIVMLAFVGLVLVQAALQGVYSAALYRYATDGNVGESFSSALLGEAFRPKR
jgi:hypothetical protein